jgi:hypothetical protein
MVREIKYRAYIKAGQFKGQILQVERIDWDFDTGQRIDVLHLIPPEGSDSDHLEIRIHGVELLQFTGLKDVDGTEIYEGDLMKHKKDLYLVEWRYGIASFCFTLLREDIKCYPNFNKGTVKSIEIVGNKFENPELLK